MTQSKFYRPPTDAERCKAKSKQTGERCKKRSNVGKTLCKFHGASRQNLPSPESMIHGGASAFVRKSQLPEIVARMRDLDSKDGKSEFIKLRTALTEQIADNIAPVLTKEHALSGDDGIIELALKVEDRLAKNVALLHEMEAEQVAQGPTTFVIGNFDPSQAAPFQSRSLDGPCTVRYLDGAPFMLDVASGGWMPCAEQTDEESGAKYFVRILAG